MNDSLLIQHTAGINVPDWQYLAVVEALSKQYDLSDESRVWHHHGDRPEHGLEVIWKLSTTSVALKKYR